MNSKFSNEKFPLIRLNPSLFSFCTTDVENGPSVSKECKVLDQRSFFHGMYFYSFIGENRNMYPAYVDPGSPYSFITMDFCKRIQAENPDIRLLFMKMPYQEVTLAQGRRLVKIGGTVALKFALKTESGEFFEIEANHFRVCQSLNAQFLIGRQTLHEYYGLLDIRDRILFLKTEEAMDRVAIHGVKFQAEHESIMLIDKAPEIPQIWFEKITQLSLILEIPAKQKELFKQILKMNFEAFRDCIGRCTVYKHMLKMDPNTPTMNPKNDRYIAQARIEPIKKIILQWLRENIVSKRGSRYISPLTIVVKENGELRPCLDSREINKYMYTRGDIVPPIDVMKTEFTGSIIFTKLDLRSGFLQIELDESCREYIAFRFLGQPFVFNRVAFGLKDAMQAFIAALRVVLEGLEHCVAVYVDDILIHSKDLDSHIRDVGQVISRIRNAGMTLRLDKCSFFRDSAKFLGFIIDQEGIRPDPKRVESIYEYRIPVSKKEVQSFLGVINFYRGHIQDFANIAAPLHELTKLSAAFQWGKEEDDAFNRLKYEMAHAILQSHPDWSKTFYVITDASNVAISGIVAQIGDDGHWRVLSMVSRKLQSAERNYHSFEKELLAIIYTIKKNEYLLVDHKIVIRTDNRALKYLYSVKTHVSERVARWRMYLLLFDVTAIQHVPGRENVAADALSRFRNDVKNDPQGIDNFRTHVRESVDFFAPVSALMLLEGLDGLRIDDIMTNIDELQERCPDIQDLVSKKHRNVTFKNGTICWTARDGESRILAPAAVRKSLIKFYHHQYTHPGYEKTLAIIRRYFDWPLAKRDVLNFLATCVTCKRAKDRNYTLEGPFKSVIAENPMEFLSIDLYGPLPKARGNVKFICVIMDVFSKFTRLYAMQIPTAANCVSKLERFLSEYAHIGQCKEIVSDNGSQFRSETWVKTVSEKGIKIRCIAAHHPQANPVETRMKVIGDCIRVLCPSNYRRWIEFLNTMERRINEVPHRTTGVEPATLFLKKKFSPNGFPQPISNTDFGIILEKARATTKRELARRKKYNEGNITVFTPGDTVYIRNFTQSSHGTGETQKLNSRAIGPCTIIGQIDETNIYKLKLPNGKIVEHSITNIFK